MRDKVEFGRRERERYRRQDAVLGPGGQERLKGAAVFVAGAGGLGSAVLPYLAAAGVGALRIYDRDVVRLDNLNRQVLYAEADEGKPKALRAGLRPLARLERQILELEEGRRDLLDADWPRELAGVTGP